MGAWPKKYPDDVAEYPLDLNTALGLGDALQSVSVAFTPWGTNELSISQITVVDNLLRVRVIGGVPGRFYEFVIELTTVQGFVATLRQTLTIAADSGATPWVPPANSTMSEATTWTSGQSQPSEPPLLFDQDLAVQALGSTQNDATVLHAKINIITGGVVGGGVKLDPSASGNFRVTNSWINPILLYPPQGANFAGLAANAPVIVASSASLLLVTNQPSSLWYVS